MFKTKNIFIAVIGIVVIGIGLYFVLTSQKVYPPSGVPETETPEAMPTEEGLPAVPPMTPMGEKEFQGMKYEIIRIGHSTDETINRVFYDIVTGKLTEEQAKTLAEKIVGDIITEDPSIKELYLLFYRDPSSTFVDVAQVIWIPNEFSVQMIEQMIEE